MEFTYISSSPVYIGKHYVQDGYKNNILLLIYDLAAASTDDTGDEGKAGAIQFCTLLRGHCNICKPFLMSPGLSSKRRTPMVWLLNL